ATNCHILFISSSEKKRLPEIFASLKGASVLTVGETDHFTESGGMINFFLEGTKMRFQINKDAATSAGLKISSKLMSLASRPGGCHAGPRRRPTLSEFSHRHRRGCGFRAKASSKHRSFLGGAMAVHAA